MQFGCTLLREKLYCTVRRRKERTEEERKDEKRWEWKEGKKARREGKGIWVSLGETPAIIRQFRVAVFFRRRRKNTFWSV